MPTVSALYFLFFTSVSRSARWLPSFTSNPRHFSYRNNPLAAHVQGVKYDSFSEKNGVAFIPTSVFEFPLQSVHHLEESGVLPVCRGNKAWQVKAI